MTAHARDQHWDAATVVAVLLAKHADQVAFLESDCYQDVSGRRNRNKQVSQRHYWRGPERDEEAQVERVPNHSVEKRRRELVLGNPPPPQPGEHLTHAEQI